MMTEAFSRMSAKFFLS